MIHSSIILAIPCPINLTPNQGLIKPNSNIKEYTESWKKVGFETLHLSLDLDPDLETRDKGEEIWTDLEQGNKRAARSDHHHQSAATTTTTRYRRGGGREREGERETAQGGERERLERRREKRKREAWRLGFPSLSKSLQSLAQVSEWEKREDASLFIGRGRENPRSLPNGP